MELKEKIYAAISALVASAATVFAPLLYLLLAVGVFLFLDFLSAIAASLKQKRGFHLSRIFESIPKAMIYFVVVSAVFYAEAKWLPGTKIGHLMCAALCLRELKSINKHSKIVLGESVLSSVINLLKKK